MLYFPPKGSERSKATVLLKIKGEVKWLFYFPKKESVFRKRFLFAVSGTRLMVNEKTYNAITQ